MKLLCLLFSFFCFNLYAQADYCVYLPLKTGEQCRPLVTFLQVKKIFKKCTGELSSGLSCRILVSMDETASLMGLSCTNSMGATEIDENIEADISLYQSSAVISASDGTEKVYTDPENVLFADHPMLQFSATGTRATILYTSWDGNQELMKNVVCE